MTLRPRTKWLLWIAVLLGGLGIAAILFVHDDPFWLIERGTDAYLWKNGVHHREIMVGAYRIHYLEAAPLIAGPEKPIVLIHGLGARASDWATLTPALAHAGFHVYALDLLGYGRSDQPTGGDFSLAEEERIVSGFLDALNLQQPDIAGWSMGGWIAMKFALDRPTRVRRLLLYDSAGLYMPIDFPLGLFTPSTPAELDQLVDRIEPTRHRLQIPGFAVPGLIRRFQRNAWVVDNSLSSMLDGKEVLDFRVQHLRMPVLLIWGMEDKLTPLSSAERLHQLVPHSVLAELPGCGHLAAAECAPQAIPPTLAFLNADPPLPPSVTVIPPPGRRHRH